MLNTFTYQKDPSLPARKIVFLLHGLGSNGQDLLGLAPEFAKELPGDVMFVSPDAPDICDMAPPGYAGSYQWFSLQNRDPQVIRQNVTEAAPELSKYIALMLKHYGLSYADVVLVGFSQGTMMSLSTGPSLPESIAGILGYSGALAIEPIETSHKMPIQLVHGSSDDVVPSSASESALEVFLSLGYDIKLELRPGLAHGIDPKGQEIGKDFLKSVLI